MSPLFLRRPFWPSILLCVLLASDGFAQTASQVTPPTARPEPPRTVTPVAIPQLSGPELPEGAASLTVRLSAVEIDGGAVRGNPTIEEARRGISNALSRKTVTVGEIFAAAQALEAAYGRAGYVLNRVAVPAQTLEDDGTLRVVVIEGFIERLETQNVPLRVRSRIEALLGALIGQRPVQLSVIERALMLAGDTPGTELRSTLAQGEKPDGSVLILEARHQAVTGSLSMDNASGAALGSVATAALQINSALGLGEQIYLQASGYPDPSGSRGFFGGRPTNRQLAIGAVAPLWLDGLTANVEFMRSDSAPNPVANQGFYSSFQRLSARLAYDHVRSRSFNLSTQIAFDAQEEMLYALTPVETGLSLDRLRVLRGTANLSGSTPWNGYGAIQITGSLGLDVLGARNAASATALLPLSRQGADATFQKLEASLQMHQPLGTGFFLDLYARGQTSFGKPLPRAEQMGLVSPTALSAFDAGAFQGDSAIAARAEVSFIHQRGLGGITATVAPYLFGSVGKIWLMQPTAVEQAATTAGSYGIGLRIGAAPHPQHRGSGGFTGLIDQATFTLELGRQYRNDGLPPGHRLSVSGAIRF